MKKKVVAKSAKPRTTKRQKVSNYAVAWGRWMTKVTKAADITDANGAEMMRTLYLHHLDRYLDAGEPHQPMKMVGGFGSRCPICAMPYPPMGPEWYPCSSWHYIPQVALDLAAAIARMEDVARGRAERKMAQRAHALGLTVEELMGPREPVKGTIPLAFAEDE